MDVSDSICKHKHSCDHPHTHKEHNSHIHFTPKHPPGSCEQEEHNHKCCVLKPCFSQKTTFIINIIFNCVVFVVELVVGHAYNSLALISDSFHMLSDIISLAVGLFALVKSHTDRTIENERNMRYSYGFERYQILGSLFNGIFLIAFSFNIFVDSMTKLSDPSPIKEPKYVISAGVLGLFCNFMSLLFFHGHIHNHEKKSKPCRSCSEYNEFLCTSPVDELNSQNLSLNQSATLVSANDYPSPDFSITNIVGHKPKSASYLNMLGVYLHIMGDFIGSVLVIIVSLLAMFINDHRVMYADPVLSILLAILMGLAGLNQLSQSIPTLLQQVPKCFSLPVLKADINAKFKDVINIHEFHIWQLASSIFVGTLHVKVRRNTNINDLVTNLHKYFYSRELYSMTIQTEIIEDDQDDIPNPPNTIPVDKYCSYIISNRDLIKNTCCPHNHRSE